MFVLDQVLFRCRINQSERVGIDGCEVVLCRHSSALPILLFFFRIFIFCFFLLHSLVKMYTSYEYLVREYWKLVPSKTRWIFDIGKLIFILENNFIFSVLCSCLGSLMSKHFRFSFTLHHIASHTRKINLHKTNNRTHTHTPSYRVQAIKHTNFMLRD